MVQSERATVDTFVELASALTGDFDLHDFLETLVERAAGVFGVTTAGLMLETPDGHLQVAVALSPEMEALEREEIVNHDGPCYEAYRTGEPVVAHDLDRSDIASRWPSVAGRMRAMGLAAVYAFPIRLNDHRLGALNVYRESTETFDDDDVRVAQAFADVAAIGILQERRVTSAEEKVEQLEHALRSRVVIEQAKGIVSAQRNISLTEAFDAIRHHARSNQRKIHDVACAIVDHGAHAIDTP